MKELFLPYEESLKLKNLGFDEPCFTKFEDYFNKTKLHPILATISLNTPYENEYNGYDQKIINDDTKRWFFTGYKNSVKDHNHNILSASTFSQAFKFFREKYNLSGDVISQHKNMYFATILNLNTNKKQDVRNKENYGFKTYEEAELECIKQLIKIVKNETKQTIN